MDDHNGALWRLFSQAPCNIPASQNGATLRKTRTCTFAMLSYGGGGEVLPVPFPPPVISPLSATGDCCAIAAGLTTPKLSVHKSIPWVVGCNGFTRSRGLHNAFFFIGQLPACEVAACFPRLTKTLVGAGWRVGEGLSANFCTQTREAMRKAKRAIGDRRGLRAPTHPASLRPPPAPPPPRGVPLAARGVGSPRKGLCGAGGASLGARAMHIRESLRFFTRLQEMRSDGNYFPSGRKVLTQGLKGAAAGGPE